MSTDRLTEMITSVIAKETYMRIGKKGLVLLLELKNGFEIVSVLPIRANKEFDLEKGKAELFKRVVWGLRTHIDEFEGFGFEVSVKKDGSGD